MCSFKAYFGSSTCPSQLEGGVSQLLIVFAEASKAPNDAKTPVHALHMIHTIPFLLSLAADATQ